MPDEAEILAEKIRNNESMISSNSSKQDKDRIATENHGLQIALQIEIANQTGDTLEPAGDKK